MKDRTKLILFAIAGTALAAYGIHRLGGAESGEPVVLTAAGSLTGSEIRAPLTAAPAINRRGDVLVFSMALSDAAGTPVRGVLLGRRTPAPPSVEVYDQAGKRVHAAALQYG